MHSSYKLLQGAFVDNVHSLPLDQENREKHSPCYNREASYPCMNKEIYTNFSLRVLAVCLSATLVEGDKHSAMARATPRQRLQETDEEGYTLVCRRGRKAPAPFSERSAPEHRRYRMVAHEEETVYGAVQRLHVAEPDLRVRLTVEGDEVYLTPADEVSAFRLSRLSREGGDGLTLEEVERRTRCVVMRYPLSYSLIPLQEHPRVTSARRCVKRVGHGRIEQTRQVEVTLRGGPLDSLDLGLWGVFSVRSYVPEPLRCFKCQAYGHVQKHCKRESELCGVCSQRHRTSECISALRNGESREACCPNCGGKHHVWSRHCPERVRRMPHEARRGSCQDERGRQPPTNPPSRPTVPPSAPPSEPATPGKKRKRRRRRKARSVPPAPLPPSTANAATQTCKKRTKKLLLEAETQTEEPPTPDTHSRGTNTEKLVNYYGEEEVVMTHDFFHKLLYEMCRLTMTGAHTQSRFVRPDVKLRGKLFDQEHFPKKIPILTDADLKPRRTWWAPDDVWRLDTNVTSIWKKSAFAE